MRGTLKIATLFKIPVFLHWSFAAILLYVLYISTEAGDDWMGTLWTLITVLSLFVCVIMHEYGHALTARKYGVKTRDIIMYPIGGVARLEKLPEKPYQEFLVAIAGPAVNVLIVLLLSPYFFFVPFNEAAEAVLEFNLSSASSYIPALMLLNIGIAIFNLIPAFPMDGGRIFRSLLAMKWGRLIATKWAFIIGRIMAVGMIIFGAMNGGFSMTLIGVFIFMMAGQEYKQVKLESILDKHTVGELMRPNYTKMFVKEEMYVAMSELRKGQERNFLVFNWQEELVGILTEKSILQSVKENRTGDEVIHYTSRSYATTTPNESLKVIFELMQLKGHTIIPVYEDSEIVGVIDIQALNYFLQLQSRMKK